MSPFLLGAMFLLLPQALLGSLSLEVPYIIMAVLAFVAVFAVVYALLTAKATLDAEQEKLSSAAGGAQWVAGLTELADFLRKAASGNAKRTFKAGNALYQKYFKTERGPLMFARDVFVKSWPHLREDKEYGNQVRELVISTALGFDKDDLNKNLDFSKAGGRLERIGWTKAAKAAQSMAVDNYREMTNSIVSLCDEVLEDDGEKKLALRVAKPTIDTVYNDAKYHDQIMTIMREYVAKDDARIAAEEAKAIERAREVLARENAKTAPAASSSKSS